MSPEFGPPLKQISPLNFKFVAIQDLLKFDQFPVKLDTSHAHDHF